MTAVLLIWEFDCAMRNEHRYS